MTSVIRFDRLSCGMPACIQTSAESNLLGIAVWINAGSAQDPPGKGGLAHLCEHLLLRPLVCTDSRVYRTLLKTGALVDACTDPEWVMISAQAPFEQAKSLTTLLSALLRDPYCEPYGMEAEKEVILQELQDEEANSAELLVRVFRESAFSGNPCAQPVGGTPATLGALGISDTQGYHARFLNASKMLITAHGGTSDSDLTAMLDEAFKDFPKTSVSPYSRGNGLSAAAQSPPEYRPVRIHKEMPNTGSGSSYGVLAGFGSVPRRTKEYWTALAFEVLMADGPGSLLTQWLRSERSWIHGPASMTEAFSEWGSQYFLLRIPLEQAEETIEYLGRQWRALSEFVTDERMEALKNRLASRALASLPSLQDRMTLMRDTVLAETRRSGTLEGGLEAIVAGRARNLNSEDILSYIRQYAEWDRVSLVSAPI